MDKFEVVETARKGDFHRLVEQFFSVFSERKYDAHFLAAKSFCKKRILELAPKAEPEVFRFFLRKVAEESKEFYPPLQAKDFDSRLFFRFAREVAEIEKEDPELTELLLSRSVYSEITEKAVKVFEDYESLFEFAHDPSRFEELLFFLSRGPEPLRSLFAKNLYASSARAVFETERSVREAAQLLFRAVEKFFRETKFSARISIELSKRPDLFQLNPNLLSLIRENVFVTLSSQFLSEIEESDFREDLARSIRERMGPIYDFLKEKKKVLISFCLYDSGLGLDQVSIRWVKSASVNRVKYEQMKLEDVLKKPSMQTHFGPLGAAWLVLEGRDRLKGRFPLKFEVKKSDWGLLTVLSGHFPSERALRQIVKMLIEKGGVRAVKSLLESLTRLNRPSERIVSLLPEELKIQLLTEMRPKRAGRLL